MFVPKILPGKSRQAVSELLDSGLSDYEISRRTGVGRATVQRWRRRGFPWTESRPRHLPADWRPPDPAKYSYLLGMYLGDGTITRHPTSFGLHVYLDTAYPGVIEECAGAMASVLRTRIGRYPRENSACLQLTSYSQF